MRLKKGKEKGTNDEGTSGRYSIVLNSFSSRQHETRDGPYEVSAHVLYIRWLTLYELVYGI